MLTKITLYKQDPIVLAALFLSNKKKVVFLLLQIEDLKLHPIRGTG